MSKNRNKTDSVQQDEANSLRGELASLFGEPVVRRALVTKVDELDFTPADVVSASRALRRLSGQPQAQQVMARCLPDDLQAAMCMWMLDPCMPTKVLKSRGGRLQ